MAKALPDSSFLLFIFLPFLFVSSSLCFEGIFWQFLTCGCQLWLRFTWQFNFFTGFIFQFHPSMYRPLQVVSIAMAAFSDGFMSQSVTAVGRIASTVIGTGNYIMNPERRAKRNVRVTRSANVHFCKAFWALSELPVLQVIFVLNSGMWPVA